MSSETLVGTTFCKQNECPSCICRTKCVTLTLISECNIIANILGKNTDELFPSLGVLHYLVFKEGEQDETIC